FLNRKDVRGFSSILVAPQLPAVVYVHQLGADQKHLTALKNTARQYSPDSELRSDVLCFIAPALVSKYRASRHHTKFGQLRKAEDDGFREAVAQVIHLRVAACIHEGQNGQRASCVFGIRLGLYTML